MMLCVIFIDQIYEPHYAHYKDDFGKTFAGFFSDEPEIGSFGGEYGHDANIGKFNMKMPWSQTLHERLKRNCGGSEFAEKFNGTFGQHLIEIQTKNKKWIVSYAVC